MNFGEELRKEEIMRELEAELEGINTYGKDNLGENYQALSEYHLPRALDALEDLLEEIKQDDTDHPIPSQLVRFRYDGGSKPKEEVMREKTAQTTAIVLDWKENHGMKLQVKPLPYYKFENNGPGLRMSGYGILQQKFLKK